MAKAKEMVKTPEISQLLLENIPFPVDVVDEKGNVLFFNKQLENIFGKKSLGKKCWELYKDNSKQCPGCPLKKGIKKGKSSSLEVSGVLGGKTIKILHTGIIYQGKKAVLEVFQDISELKRTEKDLNKYLIGFDTSPNSMALIEYNNKKPKIIRVNKKFIEYYGYSEKELLGKNPNIIKSGKQDKTFYTWLWKCLLDPKKGTWLGELVNQRKDGTYIDVILSASTIFNEAGEPEFFVANHTDISQTKRIQRELVEKNGELERFQKSVVGRELKMIELKNEISELRAKTK